jgi:hypothetical protein
LKGVITTVVDYVGLTLTPGLNGSVAKESNLGQLTIDFEYGTLEKSHRLLSNNWFFN